MSYHHNQRPNGQPINMSQNVTVNVVTKAPPNPPPQPQAWDADNVRLLLGIVLVLAFTIWAATQWGSLTHCFNPQVTLYENGRPAEVVCPR